ncbi:hypothetical protein PAHAL_8G130900 [Panicum hallii]|uniref:Uncharacterized protein n=1 Tax=Panicum hallii TaxID=206008 RepID=A0A2S3IE23_9POAL|nr:hypothetical protein PAHAL_8G130900 [Panicum hallii]
MQMACKPIHPILLPGNLLMALTRTNRACIPAVLISCRSHCMHQMLEPPAASPAASQITRLVSHASLLHFFRHHSLLQCKFLHFYTTLLTACKYYLTNVHMQKLNQD